MDVFSAGDCLCQVIKNYNNLLKVGTRNNEHVSHLIKAQLYLGFAVAGQGNIIDGSKEIEKVIDIDPDSYLPHFNFNLGLVYEKKENFDDMVAAIICVLQSRI